MPVAMRRFRICATSFAQSWRAWIQVPCASRFPAATRKRRWTVAGLSNGCAPGCTGQAAATVLPWTIHRAYLGDWSPVVEGILSGAQERDSAASFGLFFSITCNDDIAFLREADVAPDTEGTFLGDYRVRQQQAACRDWPKVSVPAGDRTPVRTSVPTLFVSGDSDPATPLWFTARVAAGFSNQAEIVVGGQGHTEWSDCVSRNYERLVRSGAVESLESSCEPVPRPPFKTTESD